MSLPTVNVTVRVFDQNGAAIAGATVTAKLSGTDLYQDQLVSVDEQSATTDVSGVAVIALFPNALGLNGTSYRFKVVHPTTGKTVLRTSAVVPNQACELADIAGNLVQAVDTDAATLISQLVGGGLVVKKADATYALRLLKGTANQITVSDEDGSDGDITLSLPQNIHAGASPTFASMTLTGALTVAAALTLSLGQITTGAAAPLSILTSGGEQFRVGHVANAVNYPTVQGGGSGVGVQMQPGGVDSAATCFIASRGVAAAGVTTGGAGGSINFYTNLYSELQATIQRAANAVNYARLLGAASGGDVSLDVLGAGSALNLLLSSKSTGNVQVRTGTFARIVSVFNDVASSVNYTAFYPSATGTAPQLRAFGNDTDIHYAIESKGTGSIYLQTNSAAQTQVVVQHAANAVNQVNLQGSATTVGANVNVVGTDTNIDFRVSSKGSGALRLNTNGAGQMVVGGSASTVNVIEIDGVVTGVEPSFYSVGGDANVGLRYTTTGSNGHRFFTNRASGVEQFRVSHTASAVNYAQATGGSTGNAVIISSQGTDTNVGLKLSSKGTGQVWLDPGGGSGDIKWGKPLVALGGGAAATLGTIGGSGPATAAQNSWKRMVDSTGAACWVPVWK